MRRRAGIALVLVLVPALASAQSLVPGGPQIKPVAPTLAPGLLPLYQPQTLQTGGPARPGADLAYGAYQRGYFRTAMQEAMKRLDANKGDAAAMTLIGELYKSGSGVRKDPAEAARWYRLAAERGDRQALFALGLATLTGDGVETNRDRAKAMLEKAAAAGHPGALYNLGIIAVDGDIQDFRAAADYFRRAAEGGNMDGAYSLAILYREGRGVPRDMREAAIWMKRAADERIVAAEVEYAIMLFNGEGTAKDEEAAAKVFLRAAIRNNPVAMNRLARLHAAGRGVKKDQIEAMKWHVLARAVGLNDEWLDGILNGMSAPDRAAVEEAVRRFVGP